jgi:hypothetical protein
MSQKANEKSEEMQYKQIESGFQGIRSKSTEMSFLEYYLFIC